MCLHCYYKIRVGRSLFVELCCDGRCRKWSSVWVEYWDAEFYELRWQWECYLLRWWPDNNVTVAASCDKTPKLSSSNLSLFCLSAMLSRACTIWVLFYVFRVWHSRLFQMFSQIKLNIVWSTLLKLTDCRFTWKELKVVELFFDCIPAQLFWRFMWRPCCCLQPSKCHYQWYHLHSQGRHSCCHPTVSCPSHASTVTVN